MILTWLLSLFGKTGDVNTLVHPEEKKNASKWWWWQITIIYRFTFYNQRHSILFQFVIWFSDYFSPEFFFVSVCFVVIRVLWGLHFALLCFTTHLESCYANTSNMEHILSNKEKRQMTMSQNVFQSRQLTGSSRDLWCWYYKVKVERCCLSIRVVWVEKMETQTHWEIERERERDRV